MSKPSRLMTNEEALAVLGPLAKVISTSPDTRIDMPATFEDVTFEYCGNGKCAPQKVHNISPRLGVFLMRLASFLHDTWNITSIQHYGMWPAGKGQPSHDAGIAIDFAGAKSSDGAVYSVLNDWGMKPKSRSGYRLSSGDHGYQFFKDLYDFTGRDGDDRWDGTQTTVGQEDSFIRHPDLKNADAAALHKDHMHLQTGQTPTGAPSAVKFQSGSSSSDGPGGGVLATGLGLIGIWWFTR